MRRGIAVVWMLMTGVGLSAIAHANYGGVDSYEEYGQRIQTSQSVSPLSDSIFGDSVSLYDGATTFEVTDVSIPGNSDLPVALMRRLAIVDHRQMLVNGDGLHGFSDWDFDVPYIDGTFTQQDGWTLYSQTPGSTARCSDNTDYPYTSVTIPGGSGFAPYAEIWGGNHLHIPGQGDQELLANTQSKSPAYASRSTYKWVTAGNWKLSCISSVTNLPGEGFVAVSPSGVSYTFNYAATIATSTYAFQYNPKVSPAGVARVHIYLLATQVKDRFGNWVKYSYTHNSQSGLTELTGITSSDGRSITVNWSENHVTSVTSALGTWEYAYSTASWTDELGVQHTWPYLSSVTRPDGSKWTYSVVSGALITNKEDWPDDHHPDPPYCQTNTGPGLPNSGSFAYRVGTPSGAVGTFTFEYGRHYRQKVPLGCGGLDSYPQHVYDSLDNFSLTSKQISGPGLVTQNWGYDYGDSTGSYYSPTEPYAWDNVEPYIPPDDCSTCSSTKTVTVTGPTSVTKYTYGTVYANNEGQLLDTEVDDLSGHVLKTVTYAYVSDDGALGEPFANIAGQDLLPKFQDPMGNRNRPIVSTHIVQDGVTFTSAVNTFDAFARGTKQTGSSGLGYSRVVQTSYYDNTSLWVLGQIASSTVGGIVANQTTYDTVTALPLKTYRFGKLQSTSAWNADGTLHTVTDGDSHVTTLSSWKGGLPQMVTYADGTHQSAVINDAGWITSVTDENGYATNYAYDAMGRLASIAYPSGDDVAWNPTQLSFTQVGSSEYGISAGHWKQIIHTGNGYTVTYFDAFWRPLVTEHYDAGKSGTLSQIVTNYDAGGRKVFTSYPTSSATSYTQSLLGTHITYDALDRVTQVAQDSELGPLPTATAYLSGFRTQVTDPRGYATVTSYQAYGEPTTQWPVSISAPQGQLTNIRRDVFGKPTSITRTGTAAGSPSLTRYYVYDGFQQLCKRIEPENGATAFAYDGAGNLAWSASGLNLPDTGNCDTSAAQSSGRVATRTYDKRNRLLTASYPDGSSNASFVYYADGALQSQTVSNGGNPVTTNYYYDRRRLSTSETLNIPGTSPFNLAYGHDANGHLSSTTYPDGRTVGYAPNALGQPTSAGTYASGATYYPNGAIASFTYGNGLVHTMTENQRGLVDRSTDTYGSTTFHDDTYAYDGDGNVAAITTPGNTQDVTMTYDSLDRLSEADSPLFGPSGADKAIYTYDVLDNLLSAKVGAYSNTAYAYNADGQLVALVEPGTTYTLHSYLYDVQGNLSNKDGEAYQFDMANRLRNVPGVGSYLYDAGGRRVQKNEMLYGGMLLDSDYSKSGQLMYQWQPSTQNATDYIYLGDTLVARVVANNASSPPAAVPAAPASITVTPTSNSTGIFSVSWPASSGATSYVLWQNANNGGWDSAFSGSNTSTTINGLASGSYIYRVQACNSSGCSGFATSGTVTVIPAPSALITVPANSFTASVPVSWQASSLANNYVLEEYPYSGGWGVAYEGANTSDTLTMPGSGTYRFQVAACGAGGCSGYTTSGNVTVTLPPGLSASTTSSISGTFSLNWSAVSTATGYNLFQNGTAVYSGSGTSWSSNGLGNGNYTYTVRSCNASGCGGASNAVTVAVNHIAPSTLSASTSNSSNGTFSLSWNTVANATSYHLYQGETLVYNSTGTSWSSNNLPNGTYTYTVYGCNGSTCGFASNRVTVTVLHVPSAPTLSASTTNSSTGSFTLRWTPATGAASYQVNVSVNGGAWTAAYDGTSTSWSPSDLGDGTYAYQSFGHNASGWGAGSNVVTVGVLIIPAAPASLTAPLAAGAGIPFTVSWSASSLATSYNLRKTRLDTGVVATVYTGPGTSTSLTMGGRTEYAVLFAVQACHGSQCSAWTNAPHNTEMVPTPSKDAIPANGSSTP